MKDRFMKFSLRSSFARQSLALMVVTWALIISGRPPVGAGGSCPGWPLCWPSGLAGWLQFSHRGIALAGAILMLWLLRRAWREQRDNIASLPLVTVSAALFFGQIFVGAMQATRGYPQHLMILHALTTVSLFISLGVLALVSAMAAGEAQSAAPLDLRQRTKDFIILTKPIIVALLLATTLAGLVMGRGGPPPLSLTCWTLLGGALAAGGSSALNQYIDRELDRKMQRTSQRPLAAGRLTPAEGLAFGLALCIASYFVLACLVNLLAAVLSLAGIFYYVLLYSVLLKKATVQNIVIGGGAGAIPPLVGWAAAAGHLGLAPLILFVIIFIWTPPHFWALAIVRKKDYARAGVPMLPVVRGEEETRRQILIYTVLLVSVSLLLPLVGLAGAFYFAAAAALGAGLLYAAWRLWRVAGNKPAYQMYRWSSMYLLFIFAALVIDTLVKKG
jgi:protoheme IX farnesyltransferase